MPDLREPTETTLGIPPQVLTVERLEDEGACDGGIKWFRTHSTNGERVITRAFLSEVAKAAYDFVWLEWLYDVMFEERLLCFREDREPARYHYGQEDVYLYSNLRDAVDYMMICLYGEIDPFGEEEHADV